MIETYSAVGFCDDGFDVCAPVALSPPLHHRFSPPSLPSPYSFPPFPSAGVYGPASPPYLFPPHSPAALAAAAAAAAPLILPKFPPPQFEIPDINPPDVYDGGYQPLFLPPPPLEAATFVTPRAAPPRHHRVVIAASMDASPPQMAAPPGVSPHGSTNTSPSRESAEEYSSDDSVPLAQLALKRSAPDEAIDMVAIAHSKKPKTQKKRKKKDPNEPQKPVSGYALFFRDTQAAIKGQNPTASFGEVSKIVASMWDSLDDEHKSVYKKKTEMAKKEYLKQLAAYRASLVSKGGAEVGAELNDKPVYRVVAAPRPPPPARPCPPAPRSPPGYMAAAHDGYQQVAPPQHPLLPVNMALPGEYAMNHQVMGATLTPDNGYGGALSPPMCIRNGCANMAIVNAGWDSEYCSNECVVNHCRDVFTAWVASRQVTASYASVK